MSNPGKENIAKLIKEARLKKGYSQQQLATLAQLNLRSVQRIENAEVLPRAYSLNLLAQQLDLDMEALKQINSPINSPPVATTKQSIPVNKARKLVLSFALLGLTTLLTAAYLSQAKKFPETNFEFFLLLSLVVAIDAFVLWRLWK